MVHLLFCLLTMPLHFSIKLLCVSTRKSVRAVVHAPAPVVVGMRYSRGVSRVREGSRCFSSTLRRASMCACVSKRGRIQRTVRGKERKGIYHGPLACLLQAPRPSADFPPSLGTHCGCSLRVTKMQITSFQTTYYSLSIVHPCPSKNNMHTVDC